MNIEFIAHEIDGDKWEKIVVDIYRYKYEKFNHIEIPARYRGDGGIEGFTNHGIVYQCYYPDKKYDDDSLYEHYRDKMTKDLNKICDNENVKLLKSMGLKHVCEWHFVIPKNLDRRLLIHANTKSIEIQSELKVNKNLVDFISPKFTVVIKVAEDLKLDYIKLAKHAVEYKLSLVSYPSEDIDYTLCDSDKVRNIEKKLTAIMGCDNPEELKDLIEIFIEAYMKGIELLKMLRLDYTELFEALNELIVTYKNNFKIKTLLNNNKSLNNDLFIKIMEEFEDALSSKLSNVINQESIAELRIDIIGMWLADCTLRFK